MTATSDLHDLKCSACNHMLLTKPHLKHRLVNKTAARTCSHGYCKSVVLPVGCCVVCSSKFHVCSQIDKPTCTTRTECGSEATANCAGQRSLILITPCNSQYNQAGSVLRTSHQQRIYINKFSNCRHNLCVVSVVNHSFRVTPYLVKGLVEKWALKL